MEELEQALAQVSLFAHLRADEISRIAKRFHVDKMASGESRAFDEARMVVVVHG